MSAFEGTPRLIRFYSRLDRVRIPIWALILAGIPIAVAVSFAELYPDPLERERLVATVLATPALTALLGPPLGATIGALTVWRVGTIASLLVGLFAALTVIRHTRAEEESGRQELLLGTTVTGRRAPLTAALTVATLAVIATGLLAALGMMAVGEPAPGSAAFGLGLAGAGLVFAAVAAAAAQLTDGAGAARGITAAVLGVTFVVRMIADGGGADWLSWASPIGWAQQLRPFADEQWWAGALFPVLALLLGAIAYWLAERRDVGSAIFGSRPGPEGASRSLSSPAGLAWRLQRRAIAAWTVGFALAGAGIGTLRDGFDRILAENPQLAAIFEAIGGEMAFADVFQAAIFGIFAIIVSAYGIGAVLELLSEEEALRAEQVLATPVDRRLWGASYLLLAVLAPALMLVAGGVGVATTSGSFAGELVPTVGATLVHLPAVWVVVGITMALYGIWPRRTSLAWAALVVFLLLGQLGELLRLPDWAMGLSPFTHTPDYPAASLNPAPLIGLFAVAVVLVALGLSGFRRRDLV